MQTEVGALCSVGRDVVLTVLTREWSQTGLLILNLATVSGQVTPSIVRAWTGNCDRLTGTNGLVLEIIVFDVAGAACAPIGIWDL
jgi:hypothetical protein